MNYPWIFLEYPFTPSFVIWNGECLSGTISNVTYSIFQYLVSPFRWKVYNFPFTIDAVLISAEYGKVLLNSPNILISKDLTKTIDSDTLKRYSHCSSLANSSKNILSLW